MSNFFLVLLFLIQPQSDFTSFRYCVENARGPWQVRCVELDSEGEGRFNMTPRGAERVDLAVELSTEVAAEFIDLLEATNYLAYGDRYESNRNVADLGTKKLSLQGPMGLREAEFNFSTRREVKRLVVFFDNLIMQELLVLDIDIALQFDRLAIPKKLDQIEKQLRAKRVTDVKRLIPVLERIESDRRLVNFAREIAARLRREIEGRD